MHKFHEEKNQQATSFMNEIKHTASSANKNNQHAASSMKKISFTGKKINT